MLDKIVKSILMPLAEIKNWLCMTFKTVLLIVLALIVCIAALLFGLKFLDLQNKLGEAELELKLRDTLKGKDDEDE